MILWVQRIGASFWVDFEKFFFAFFLYRLAILFFSVLDEPEDASDEYEEDDELGQFNAHGSSPGREIRIWSSYLMSFEPRLWLIKKFIDGDIFHSFFSL